MAGERKEIAELIKLCLESEAVREVVEQTKHWQVTPSDPSKKKIFISKTPSDWRAVENARADLRGAGLEVPHRRGTHQDDDDKTEAEKREEARARKRKKVEARRRERRET
jgi:hypothetical protein